jgi:hypothetical protein
MIDNKPKIIFLGFMLTTLMGCASKNETRLPFDSLSIEKQMVLSAKAVAESKQIRARSENALRLSTMTDEERAKYKQLVSYIPPGMDLPLEFNERLEAETFLKLIAQMTRWDFEVKGKRPVNGAMVYLNVKMTPAIDVIYDIDSQIKGVAKIILVEYEKGNEKNGMIILDFSEKNI